MDGATFETLGQQNKDAHMIARVSLEQSKDYLQRPFLQVTLRLCHNTHFDIALLEVMG